MDSLNPLFHYRYNNSQQAIEHFQSVCNSIGFSIRIRTSKRSSIYIVCSKEGKSNSHRMSGNQYKYSDRCSCKWRVILSNNVHDCNNTMWTFRRSGNMKHNHSIGNCSEANTPKLKPSPIVLENTLSPIKCGPFSMPPLPSIQILLEMYPLYPRYNSEEYEVESSYNSYTSVHYESYDSDNQFSVLRLNPLWI